MSPTTFFSGTRTWTRVWDLVMRTGRNVCGACAELGSRGTTWGLLPCIPTNVSQVCAWRFGSWAYCHWPWRSRLALRMNKPTDTHCLLHPHIESIPQDLESYFQHSYQTHLPSPLCSSRALGPVSHFCPHSPPFPPPRQSRENVVFEMQVWFCSSPAWKAFF